MHSGVDSNRAANPIRTSLFHAIALLTILPTALSAQETTARRSRLYLDKTANHAWAVNAYIEGYYVPGEQGYVDPILTADHRWLHLEGRYNYEDIRTGSIWLGYNLNFTSADKSFGLRFTPMLGGVFGRTTGIAPGCVASLTYKKLGLWVSNEYVFDTGDSSNNFFYTWPQLTYTPVDWFHVGFVAQRTFAIESDTQGGFLVGLSHKKIEFTSYILDPGPKPTVILELGYSF